MAPEIPVPPGLAGPQNPPSGRRAAVPDAFFPRHTRPGTGRGQVWLPVAAGGLFALSAAAATVSYGAQYRLVDAARHLGLAAALEAAIPDAAALVFACLGVALAVHGRRAIRARLLNLASAGASVFMNVIAAAPGWRNLAVWAMPPAAYALASDTLIAVVRTGAAARRQDEPAPDAGTGGAPLLAALTGLALAAAAVTCPEVDRGRVPQLGHRRVPGRSRPPGRPPGSPRGRPDRSPNGGR